jgi:hypothetical protein
MASGGVEGEADDRGVGPGDRCQTVGEVIRVARRTSEVLPGVLAEGPNGLRLLQERHQIAVVAVSV